MCRFSVPLIHRQWRCGSSFPFWSLTVSHFRDFFWLNPIFPQLLLMKSQLSTLFADEILMFQHFPLFLQVKSKFSHVFPQRAPESFDFFRFGWRRLRPAGATDPGAAGQGSSSAPWAGPAHMFWAKHYTFDWNITILLQYYQGLNYNFLTLLPHCFHWFKN